MCYGFGSCLNPFFYSQAVMCILPDTYNKNRIIMNNFKTIFLIAGLCFAAGILSHQAFDLKWAGYILVGASVVLMIIGGNKRAKQGNGSE